MLRSYNLARLALQTRYVQNHKKPVVESTIIINSVPSKTPPKYVYEIKYHPNANPGIDMGFPNHGHNNPWNDEAFVRYENFKWRYSG